MNDEFPWNTYPKTVDETAAAVEAVMAWERTHPGEHLPAGARPMATNEFVIDLAQRLADIEARLDNL